MDPEGNAKSEDDDDDYDDVAVSGSVFICCNDFRLICCKYVLGRTCVCVSTSTGRA